MAYSWRAFLKPTTYMWQALLGINVLATFFLYFMLAFNLVEVECSLIIHYSLVAMLMLLTVEHTSV